MNDSLYCSFFNNNSYCRLLILIIKIVELFLILNFLFNGSFLRYLVFGNKILYICDYSLLNIIIFIKLNPTLSVYLYLFSKKGLVLN